MLILSLKGTTDTHLCVQIPKLSNQRKQILGESWIMTCIICGTATKIITILYSQSEIINAGPKELMKIGSKLFSRNRFMYVIVQTFQFNILLNICICGEIYEMF